MQNSKTICRFEEFKNNEIKTEKKRGKITASILVFGKRENEK